MKLIDAVDQLSNYKPWASMEIFLQDADFMDAWMQDLKYPGSRDANYVNVNVELKDEESMPNWERAQMNEDLTPRFATSSEGEAMFVAKIEK